jgi:hypothetical protein
VFPSQVYFIFFSISLSGNHDKQEKREKISENTVRNYIILNSKKKKARVHKKEYRNPSLRHNLRKGEKREKIPSVNFHEKSFDEIFFLRIGFSIYKIY